MPDRVAYHEAGHAFMAIYVGARVRSVTIEPDWDDGPERFADIQVEWPLDQCTDREFHEKSVLVALAGPVAEMIHSGEPYHPGFVAEWAADWKLAWKAATSLVSSERKRLAYLEQTTARLTQEIEWAAGDMTENRPALSRWHPDYEAAFAAFMAKARD